MELHSLKNTTREFKRTKRLGRGPGSGLGKTCGRGIKGAGARSGWKSRTRYEGGQMRLYLKLPQRGFSNERFREKRFDCVNLGQIDDMYLDGETVNVQTLKDRGFISGRSAGIKLLADGELSKNVKFEVQAMSLQAEEKIKSKGLSCNIVERLR